MEARNLKAAWLAVILLVSMGAQQRSANFIVETPDPNYAKKVAETAERLRGELAVAWLGEAMPNWAQPCVMSVQVGPHLGAGGATTFIFDRGEVFGWRMTIQGPADRILDSVLPHEITHMIFASRFRQPLPRWADEGGATSVEHASERNKHRQMLNQFLRTGRGIAFSQMFAMTEYPQDIMPLYAQGYSLADFLIQTAGRRKYVEFLAEGLENDDWTGALQRHYNIKDLSVLQNTWLAWVRQGSPAIQPRKESSEAALLLASNQRPARPEPNLIYRMRNQEPATPLAGLVPVRLPSSTRPRNIDADLKVASHNAPVRTPSPPIKWLDPSRSFDPPADRIETADARTSPRAASAAGWHAPGIPAPTAAPAPVQVAHPQPLEGARQTILE